MLNNIARKTAAFVLTAATGFALTVMPSGYAEASTVNYADANKRVWAKTLNPICKAGDTVYRVRVGNDSKRWQDFSYNRVSSRIVGDLNYRSVAGGVMLEPGGSVVFRFRVRPMVSLDYNVNLNVGRSTETLEVLSYGVNLEDVCN